MTHVHVAVARSSNNAMEKNSTDQLKEIKPIAIPGIHEKFYQYLNKTISVLNNPKILDLGAGHGYLVKKLFDAVHDVHATDLFPDFFYFDKVKCHNVDLTKVLPFDDDSFDVLLAVEVMEHIFDHELFFNEANRILKKGGFLFFTTPNILSLKSRFRFLLSGFFYSFSPLDYAKNDGLQHVASLTIDQYKYLALKSHFDDVEISFDKRQSSSMYLLIIQPFIWLYSKLNKIKFNVHNKFDYLTGRILFVKLKK